MSLKWIRFGAGSASSVRNVYTALVDAVVANTTTETTMIGAGQGGTTVPANSRVVASTNELLAEGLISSSGNPSLRLQLKLGSVILADTGVVSIGNGTDLHWTLEAISTLRTTGVTGTLAIGGSFVTPSDTIGFTRIGVAVIDTTTDQTIDVTATWGTASASNSITTQVLNFTSFAPP